MDFSAFVADSHQENNPEGIVRMWKILAKSFTTAFPVKADVATGEITKSITSCLPAGFEIVEYVMPSKTIAYSDELGGESGFMDFAHFIEFEAASLSKEMFVELFKDINAPAVYVAELADNKICVIGSSQKGLMIKSTGQSGKNGDKRGRKYTAENRGLRWPVMPLSDTAKRNFLIRSFGFGPYFNQNVGTTFDFLVGTVYQFKLKTSDGNNVPLTNQTILEAGTVRASVAYNVGDQVLITRWKQITLNTIPHKQEGQSLGWALATITAMATDGTISFNVTEKSLHSFTAIAAVAFNPPIARFNGLTSGFSPGNNYFGAITLDTAGQTLPYVVGENVYIYTTSGNGVVRFASGTVSSYVGTTLVLQISAQTETVSPAPAAMTGWTIMKGIYVA